MPSRRVPNVTEVTCAHFVRPFFLGAITSAQRLIFANIHFFYSSDSLPLFFFLSHLFCILPQFFFLLSFHKFRRVRKEKLFLNSIHLRRITERKISVTFITIYCLNSLVYTNRYRSSKFIQ